MRMVGHGSSDNAASYGVYAFGLLPRWTALRDSITLGVYYESELDLSGSAVLALSQSGRTPDVIAYVERARARGAFTIAVTNDSGSAWPGVAEAVLPLAAGPERAVAATKTYLNQVAALALLAACSAGQGRAMVDDLRVIAEQVDALIPAIQPRIATLAQAFAYVGRMFVIGRGVEFATAREIALKLQETCRVAADSLTATDLAHGPVAALDPLFPVWAIASADAALPAVLDAAARRARWARPWSRAERGGADPRPGPRPPRPLSAVPAALPAPLDRPGPAVRARARAGEGTGRGSARRVEQGHAGALEPGGFHGARDGRVDGRHGLSFPTHGSPPKYVAKIFSAVRVASACVVSVGFMPPTPLGSAELSATNSRLTNHDSPFGSTTESADRGPSASSSAGGRGRARGSCARSPSPPRRAAAGPPWPRGTRGSVSSAPSACRYGTPRAGSHRARRPASTARA